MNGEDTYLLKLMGYTTPHDCKNEDEFILKPIVATHLRKLAFELFLSQVYCRKVKSLCTEAKKYDVQVIISMLQNDVVYIEKNAVKQICEQIKQGVGRASSYYQHVGVEKKNIQTSQLLPSSEVDDDDLYGDAAPKQCENPVFDQDNSNSIGNVEVYDDHAFDKYKPRLGDYNGNLELVNPHQSMKHSMMPIKDRMLNATQPNVRSHFPDVATQQTARNEANTGNIYESDFHMKEKRSDYLREGDPAAKQSRENVRSHFPDVATQQTALNEANTGNIYESDFHMKEKRSDYSREGHPTVPHSREDVRSHFPDVQHSHNEGSIGTHKANVNIRGQVNSSMFYTNTSDIEKGTLPSRQQNQGIESDRNRAGNTDSHHSSGSNYTANAMNRETSAPPYPTNSNKKPATKIPTIYQQPS